MSLAYYTYLQHFYAYTVPIYANINITQNTHLQNTLWIKEASDSLDLHPIKSLWCELKRWLSKYANLPNIKPHT